MHDRQLTRYAKHILLPQIGYEGQQKLQEHTVLVVGAGGLGCPALVYLAGCGIGHLILADDDRVELSNLQRQILYCEQDLGKSKAQAAAQRLQGINSSVRTTCITHRMDGASLGKVMGGVDLVLDCSDNFMTRYSVNRACWRTCTPLVSAAAIRFEAQVSVFDANLPHSPCYHCLFPQSSDDGVQDEQSCSSNGVFAPLTGIIGTMQAQEAIRHLLGLGAGLVGRLLLYDALDLSWRTITISKNRDCEVCGLRVPPTEAQQEQKT